MPTHSLEKEICQMALESGWQRFFPTSGVPYNILSEFGIHNAGMSSHKPPFQICRLNFVKHSAYFGISGTGKFSTPKGSGSVDPGDVWLVPAMYPHNYWVEKEWTYVWVHFRNEGYWRSFAEHGERKAHFDRMSHLQHVAIGMLEYADRWDDQEVMEEWARMLVLFLRLELMEPNDTIRRWRAVLSNVWREVKVDPARNWRAEELAAMSHMSLTHFNRAMRQVYDTTASGMLARIRLARALTLMRATTMKLDGIAELTGYSTGFALSKAFQRMYGESPRRLAGK